MLPSGHGTRNRVERGRLKERGITQVSGKPDQKLSI